MKKVLFLSISYCPESFQLEKSQGAKGFCSCIGMKALEVVTGVFSRLVRF